jgi:hypothetical protein
MTVLTVSSEMRMGSISACLHHRGELAVIRFINRRTWIAQGGISLSRYRSILISAEQASQYHGGSTTKRANSISEFKRGHVPVSEVGAAQECGNGALYD